MSSASTEKPCIPEEGKEKIDIFCVPSLLLRMHSTCIGLLFGAGWGRVATSYRNHTHRQQLRSNHKTEENCRVTDCAAVTTGSPAQPHHGSSTANLPRGLIVRRVCAAVRRYFGAADNTH